MAETQWQEAEDSRGNATHEFIIERAGKRKVTGAVWLPAGTARDVLVCFGHGASGDRYQAPIPNLAARFIGAGYPCLAIDGPVHGLRQVGPGGREAFAPEMRRDGAIDDMVDDWNIAIDTVEARADVNVDRFAYFGLSMGCAFGIPLMASRTRAGKDVSVATTGLLGTSGAMSGVGKRIADDAKAIECPLLFLMQLEDELFPRDGYLELFDALGSSDKRIHANPGLHPEIPAEEIDHAYRFIVDHLEGRGDRRIVNPIAE